MYIYAIMLAITFFLTFLTSKKIIVGNSCYVRFATYKSAFVSLLPFLIISICRWDVGIDSVYGGTYWTAYQHSFNGNNILGFEPLFFLFMKICVSVGIPFWGFLAIHCLIFMSCAIYAIKKGANSLYISITLFFSLFVYFDSFSSLRQSLSEALCMIVISIMLTEEESRSKDIKSIILLVVASGFHRISLMYLPIYFLCKKKFSTKGIIYAVVIAIGGYPILQKIFTMIMRYFFKVKYSFIGVSQYNLLLSFIVLLVCILFYKGICGFSKYSYKAINLSLVVFVVMLNSGALLLPYRCFDCLKIIFVFIIPIIIKSIRRVKSRFITAGIFLIIFGYWFINAFFIQKSAVTDYHSIFENLSVIYLS